MIRGFWNFVKAWVSRQYASAVGFSPRVINWYVRVRRPERAVTLMEKKFNERAPKEERDASNEPFRMKWAFPDAAQFLVRCTPTAAAAVIHQYTKIPEISFRASVFVELMLTLPMISNDPEKYDKVNEIISLVARINGSLMEDVLKKGQAKPAYELVSRIKEKEVPKAMRFTPVETGAYLLRKLRADDPDYYAVFEGKLHAEYAEKIIAHWNLEEFHQKSGRGWEHPPPSVEPDDESKSSGSEPEPGKSPEEPPE